VTENPIVPFRAAGSDSPAAVNDLNSTPLQICCEWMREQRTESVERDWIAPDRPRKPIITIVTMETGGVQYAATREGRKERKCLGGKEYCGTYGPICLVLLGQFVTERMEPLCLWIPAQGVMVIAVLPRAEECLRHCIFRDGV
jgi:hypothetical protein